MGKITIFDADDNIQSIFSSIGEKSAINLPLWPPTPNLYQIEGLLIRKIWYETHIMYFLYQFWVFNSFFIGMAKFLALKITELYLY